MVNLFRRKERNGNKTEIRKIKVGKENSGVYASNKIVTSKYTAWNFLPKNLFEQFRRIANFYFLIITIISFLVDSPVGPVTSLLPLLFVLLVTAVKQGYEDFLRHRSDRELNYNKVWILRNSCLQKIPSKKVRVGDIVKVFEDENIPCDLVLLTSSHESSKCYVTTANLDGETNIKTFYCPKSLKRNIKSENITHLEAEIECENPTPDLFKFNGRIEFSKMTSDMIRRYSLQRQTSLFQEGRVPDSQDFPFVNSSDNSYLSNGIARTGKFIASLSSLAVEDKRQGDGSLTNTFEGVTGDFRSSSPQLGRLEPGPGIFIPSKSKPKRNLTLPKRSLPKHKKTFSNVTNASWNPDFFEALKNAKWTSKRRDSEKENLVDPLTSENLLLRGYTLKNTEFIYGCAIYTGEETKIALNSKLIRKKFSVVEKSINKLLLVFLGLLLVESIASTIFDATIEIKYGSLKFKSIFIDEEDGEPRWTFLTILKDLFQFTMVYNYLIPISLYVTLEITKFFGSLLFQWDLSLYDETTDQSALCNTSDLNEELGEIEYLFTDKTGTLTENNLRFHSCSINGISYQEQDNRLYREDSDVYLSILSCPEETEIFLLALTLCNSVQVIVEKDEPFHYSATSPDEKALVEAMQRLNIVFANDDDFAVVNFAGKERIFQKLEILEFSSSRKRMSVIVKDEDGNITLFCKGAESAVIPKVNSGPIQLTLEHVSNFAKVLTNGRLVEDGCSRSRRKGLRTLVVGYKTLTENEYHFIEEKVRKARETLSGDREEVVSKTYDEVEDGLILLGATGVEDKLQEGVQDTLESLREAGIKVWMLTGDKIETAVKISLICGLFTSDMKKLTLAGITTESSCLEELDNIHSTLMESDSKNFGLIIDGTSLTHALKACPELFREACTKCTAVVCCRLSPLQKSQIVSLVKNGKDAPIVAAIGDGANDVPMIKEAHVGLGIMGKEGRQAVLCSDFAFAKFRFLKKVLLVHGHWYYIRTAELVQYFFYKNIVFITPQFYFFFFAGYSVQQLYDSLFYICYNTVFTSLPVFLYGIFEQNYPQEKLLKFPGLYKLNKKNVLFTWKYFYLWVMLGVWHSLVIFFTPTIFYQINPTGMAQECLENYGTTIFHNAVIVVNLKLLLHARFWSVSFVGSIVLSVVGMFLLTLIYSSIYMHEINPGYYLTYNRMIQSPVYWLLCILMWVTALIPDILVYIYSNTRIRAVRPLRKRKRTLEESAF